MSRRSFPKGILALVVVAAVLMSGAARAQMPSATPASTRPEDLIKVLRSDAPKPEKAVACKFLAVYGGKEAVPALAPLLHDPELASWARIPLEAIPDPSADAALLDAAGKLQGRLLVGVINSIAVRRDAKALDVLAQKLQDPDVEVASAAANALGRIGSDRAAEALEKMLTAPSAAPALRSAAAEGCVLCAERYLADGNAGRATALYDAVRKADVPKQRVIEGTRGAILARGSGGVPLLVEQLRSTDKAMMNIGLRVSRELLGGDVTQALIAEFGRAEPGLQALLVVALADRRDAAVNPVILRAAQSGAAPVRLAAIGMLDRLADPSSAVPILVEAAASTDAEMAQTARAALVRLPGKEVDAALLARLRESGGRGRQVLIELVEQRKIEGALPIFLSSTRDADAGVRTAAVEAVGAIGDDKQLPELIKLLTEAKDAGDRRVLERATSSIAGRWGAASVPHLAPLARDEKAAAETRIVALHALAACGGPDAMATLRATLADKDPAIQDEAVRTLSTWPNRWPEDAAVAAPLLELAKSAEKVSHRVLAVRGYLQYVQGDKKLPADQRLALVDAIQPLISRPEERRLAIATISGIGSPVALERLAKWVADPAVSDEAAAAVVRLAGRANSGIPNAQRRAALQVVAEQAKSKAVADRAKEMLKDIPNR